MHRTGRTRSILTALVLLLAAAPGAPALAGMADQWPLIDRDRARQCELQLAGNGRFLEIRAYGLVPGEALRLTLTNGDMSPIDWQVFANRSGAWSHLYIPFRFNRDGGTVRASLSASQCALSVSAPWTRGARTIA